MKCPVNDGTQSYGGRAGLERLRLPSAGAEMRFHLCVWHCKIEVPSGSQTPNPRSLRQPAPMTS